MNSNLDEYINGWGFCPHIADNEDGDMCDDCHEHPSQRSFSLEQASTLTHERQVAIFGWCSCEDNEGKENSYDDCPKE